MLSREDNERLVRVGPGTPMGARRLRDWILHPFRELEPLRARQDVIEALIAQPFILSKCRETLRDIRDIERTLSRLNQAGNARDMQVLGQSLKQMPEVRAHLEALGGGLARAGLGGGETRGLGAAGPCADGLRGADPCFRNVGLLGHRRLSELAHRQAADLQNRGCLG